MKFWSQVTTDCSRRTPQPTNLVISCLECALAISGDRSVPRQLRFEDEPEFASEVRTDRTGRYVLALPVRSVFIECSLRDKLICCCAQISTEAIQRANSSLLAACRQQTAQQTATCKWIPTDGSAVAASRDDISSSLVADCILNAIITVNPSRSQHFRPEWSTDVSAARIAGS